MSKIYDCIVLGVGGLGSAALYYAARKGWKTIGLDRFQPGHARGSSHGRSRIIRQAYFEHPDYVPLLLDSFQMWKEAEQLAGIRLFQQTGLLQIGNPDGPIIKGIRQSASQNQLALKEFSTDQLRKSFSIFNCRDGDVGLFEELAGFLYVEDCVRAFVDLATRLSAKVIEGVTIDGWCKTETGFEVSTDQDTWHGRRLIITAGAWASQLLPEFSTSLKVIAKHQHWFRIPDDRTNLDAGFPTFFFETDQGYFYGFPDFDGHGNKVAEHSGGNTVQDPLSVNRELDSIDLNRVQDFIHQYFNAPRGIHREHNVCMYTMSPDEFFIVDVADEKLSFACGMSGHGFKFAPVLGKALVDMVDGDLRSDMEFLRASRFNTATN